MGERELPAILYSRWAESIFWDSRSQAAALLPELHYAEAIVGFGSGGPSILLGNIELSEINNWPGLCIYGSVVQGYLPPMDSWHRANNLRHLSGGLHIPIKHRLIYLQRASGMSRLHLNVQCLERCQSVCTASTNSKPKRTWWKWSKVKYTVHYEVGNMCFGGLLSQLRHAWAGMTHSQWVAACQSWPHWNPRMTFWAGLQISVVPELQSLAKLKARTYPAATGAALP